MRTAAKAIPILVLVLASFAAASANADGNAEAGKTKALTCTACHGPNGVSVNPEWPSLAGQHASYIKAQLEAYRSGNRVNALMSGMAANLSNDDIADLAAYYSAQPRPLGVADPALVNSGERLYRGGNKDTGASACIACHGPGGKGNPTALMPLIAGQQAVYTATQLRAYAAGERKTDRNQMMRNVALLLSDAEIAAVASYIQGLRSSQ